MEFVHQLEGGPTLVFRIHGLLGTTALYIDRVKQERSATKGKPWLVRMNDGQCRTVTVKNAFSFMFDPKITIDGTEIAIGRTLAWWELLLSGLPFLLLFIGGALGALAGSIAGIVNIGICRSDRSVLKKVLLTTLTTIIAVIAFFAAATAVQTLMK